MVFVLGRLDLIVENASLTAEAIGFGGCKDRTETVSTGMSMGIRLVGLSTVSQLQQSRVLVCPACSFRCADSCDAMRTA